MSEIIALSTHAAPVSKDVLILDQVHIHMGKRCVLHNVDLRLSRGSMTAIMGANGAGKTSLLKSLVGIVPVTSGSIDVDRNDQTIGYLPQITDFDRDFPVRVRDLIAMGLIGKGLSRAEQKSVIADILEQVNLSGYAASFVQDLSAGQLKRALMGRMIAQDADIWCLDEPFAELDRASCDLMMAILRRMQSAGKTILVVIHDDQLLRQGFDFILSLQNQTATLHKNPHLQPGIIKLQQATC
ncbi:MAG: ATP-binding cassette domain-containing protein [Alphaproteobacteria bacterium]|nr:MAG: ATP-binding cassette domain-containing protein [Alphaproteobacteria bacterium]